MPDTLNQASATPYALLIGFIWGAAGAHVARYTSWTDNVTADDGFTYTPAPSGSVKIETRILVEPAAQTGAIKDEPWTLTMPAVQPLTFLSRDSVWAPVTCTISECDPTAALPTRTVLWTGLISQTWKNPKGMPGAIRAEIAGGRAKAQYPASVESKTGCSRTFGDAGCGVPLAPIQQTALITTLNGKILSAPSLTIPGGMPSTWWTDGWVEYDGLRIPIVDGSAGPSALRLLHKPPPEWGRASNTVTIVGPPASGTFTLSVDAGGHVETTSPIAYNSLAAAVQAALESLSNVGAGNVTVTGPLGGPWDISFSNSIQPLTLSASGAGLIGGDANATQNGVVALFTPGCDKSYEGGCTIHANKPRFFGIGIRKPPASPLMWPR